MSETPRAEDLPTDPDRADLSDPMTTLFQRTFRDTHDLEAESMEARILADLFGLEVARPKVGRFEVHGRLGGGGMGEVYLAWDPELQRKVAIKLMRRRRHANAADLQREARALALVDSPHVVPIYEYGVHGDRGYLAMKNIEGRTLAQWQREPRSLREIISVYAQAARGLAEIHRTGVVHCDFKPSNVLVDANNQAWVADFGLARLVDDDDDSAGGTRGYMAPEQLLEGVNSPASDQFSFCIALFSAIHGASPFPGPAATLGQRLARCEIVVPPATRKIPAWLTRLLERGLRRDPSQRFPSMETLRAELIRDHGKTARRGAWVTGAFATAVAAIALLLPRPDPLAGVWDDERRGQLEQRFAELDDASGKVVIGILEEWATKWRGEWQRAEVGGSVVSDEGAMSDCLADQRTHVEELVNELLHVEPERLWIAPRDPNELPDPVLCRHATQPALDPARVATYNGQLGDARAARLALDFEDSRAIASELLDTVRDWPAMRIDALHERGLAWSAASEPELAIADLKEAKDLAIEQKEWGRVAELYIDLVWAADTMTSPEIQLEWLENARAFEGNLSELALAARIPLGRALIALDAGDPEHAELLSRANLSALETRGTSGTLHELETRHILAMALASQGRPDEAEAEYRFALGRADDILSPRHPQKAKLLCDAGLLALDMGEPALARQRVEQGLRLQQDNLPANHPLFARSYIALARLEYDQGNYEAVEANVHEALAIGIERSREYEAYMILGQVNTERQNWSVAADLYERAMTTAPALEIEQAQIGLLLAQARANLGDLEAATVDFDRFLHEVESQLEFPLVDDSLCPIWAARIQALGDSERAREETARVRKLIGRPENCPTLNEVPMD